METTKAKQGTGFGLVIHHRDGRITTERLQVKTHLRAMGDAFVKAHTADPVTPNFVSLWEIDDQGYPTAFIHSYGSYSRHN